MKIPKALRAAAQHHQAGRLAEAETIYRQILTAQPGNADALHQLGLLAQQCGQPDLAVDLLWQAIMASPSVAAYHNDLGNALGAQGNVEDAAAAYRRAIELRPGFSEAHNNLGVALRVLGRFADAIAAYREAIRWQPDSAQAHYNLGNLLRDQDRAAEAVTAYQEALRVQPEHFQAHHNLGLAWRALGRGDEAMAAYRRVLALKPDATEALINLGNLVSEQGLLDEASALYQRAIDLAPASPEGYYGLAAVLRAHGRFDAADASYRQALQLQPEDAEARFNHSLLLLLRGEYRAAWPLFEARWEARSMNLPKRTLPQPEWQGEPLLGRRIFVHAEQGLGDTLQFIRYAALLAARGGFVIVYAPQPLLAVLRRARGVSAAGGPGDPPPAFDVHVPMLSLPRLFDTTVETIPADVPYLTADPARVAAWTPRFASSAARLKVGLSWAGNPQHRLDGRRSLPLAAFVPILQVEGVDFFSLQKGRGSEEIAALPAGTRLLDLSPHLETFAETAAAMAHLDLVISVDTAVAHLAGALGRPVWTMLAFSPDWRWLLHRTDSPWYPTMRLFRQARFRAWEPVIAEVREQLRQLAPVARRA